jgi:transglutaminase-like putative cysteine protease
MIARLVVLCLSGALAYALLRGVPEAFPPLVRSCLAVLLLVGGLGWWAVRRKGEDLLVAKGSGKPKWRDFLAIGMGILALECGFLWVLSAAPAPLEEVAVMIEAKLQPEAAAERAVDAASVAGTGNWLWSDEGRRALPRRTNLKPGVKPEVFIRLSRETDAQKLLERKTYVRAFALDDFRNGVWSTRNLRDNTVEANEGGWIRFEDRRKGEILHEVFHGRDPRGRDVLTALQGVRAVRLPELRVAAEGMVLLPDASGSNGYGYMAGSLPLGLEDLKGRDVRQTVSGASRKGRFSELAAKAAGEGDVLEKLLNIQAFLRKTYGYSLVTENPRNLDPLDNFLFGEKKGHCEFFATAGALMARELGLETRVAYGWAGGEYFKESLMFVFRAREAHAWVEVNVPGHGWAVMEPTPPVVLGGGGVPRSAAAGELPPSPDEILTEEEIPELANNDHVAKVALGLMAAFGVAALIAFMVKGWRRPSDAGGFATTASLERKGGYLRAWRRACEDRGLRWPAGATLRRQLEEIEGKPGFGDDLLGYHYGLKYEGKSADPKSEGQLVEKIKEWQ